MKLTKTQVSAMSRLFSSGVLRELAKKGRSPLFSRLYSEVGIFCKKQEACETVGSFYEHVLTALKKPGFRHEYVYRSAITHNIFLGRHSLNTASMLTEFRVGECKADVVILNGSGTVYEIKSDRDSLVRLGRQVENYYKFFSKVYVISGGGHIDEVISSVPGDVGVLSLTERNQISTIRKAAENFDLACSATMFDSLRVCEAERVLKNFNIAVPDVPNTLLRSSMREIFEKLSPVQVHDEVVSVLKRSRSLASLGVLAKKLPPSLQPAVLSIPMHGSDHERLLSAVSTPLNKATKWA